MEATAGTACSKCGAVKREANHWFVFVTNSAGGTWQPFETFEVAQDGEDVFIVCGESCALMTLSAWFREGAKCASGGPPGDARRGMMKL